MKTLVVGLLAFAALFFIAAWMFTAKADEVLVYTPSLDNVRGLWAIKGFNPAEDLFTPEECHDASLTIQHALGLQETPICREEIVLRQQG